MFRVERRAVPRPSRLAAATLIAFVAAATLPAGAAEPGECIVGPAVSVSDVAGSPYHRFDGRICTRGTPAEIAQLFHLDEAYCEWSYRCEQAKTLTELGSGHRIFYFRHDGPLFFPDQEVLAEARMQKAEDGNSVRVRLIGVADDDPRLVDKQIPRHAGAVRTRSLDAEWIVTRVSPERVEIRYRVWLVPGGVAPSGPANAMTRISVRKSLRNLRRLLEAGRIDLSGTALFDGLPPF